MLRHLTIRDYAIVQSLDIELDPGLSVVTGETGAGKSILLDALGLALGDRASSASVRPSARRAEVAVEFDVEARPDASHWLVARELEDPDDPTRCLLRRTIGADGRSRGYINGRPVNAQDLTELAGTLLDIHTQHAHQSLLRPPIQLDYVDAFGGYVRDLKLVAERWAAWQEAQARLESLLAGGGATADLEYLAFQVEELVGVALPPEGYEAISAEHRQLSSSDAHRDALDRALHLLSGSDAGVLERVQQVTKVVSELAAQGVGKDAATLLTEARIALEEAEREVGRLHAAAQSNPERVAQLDEQLRQIHQLARKHKVRPEALQSTADSLANELQRGQEEMAAIPALTEEVDALREQWAKAASALSKKRRRTATKLAKQVTALLQDLGMPNSKFEIAFTPHESAKGMERASYQVSANVGLPLRPIAEVASGGELSRISLAIQVIAAATSNIPTLVLDEADAGVGGRTAEIIGRNLRTLGATTQILCVTHSPQVAAMGHQHLRVEKDDTGSTVVTLDQPERIEEVARMIGGSKVTQKARARAAEMVELADQ